VAVFATAAALVSFSPASQPAEAGWVGASGAAGCNGVNMASSASISFYYLNLSSVMTSAQDYVRSNAIDPTDLASSSAGSLTSTTDIIVRDLDYATYCGYDWFTSSSGGVTGLSTCDALTGSKCKQHSIRYSTNYVNIASTTQRRGLACHETGHSIGLSHASSDASCMKPEDSTPATGYNSTEVGWINAAY
jgi:hypothetical protein